MIESAPYIHDWVGLALSAPKTGSPVALVSAPSMPTALNRYSIAAVTPAATLQASHPRSELQFRPAGRRLYHKARPKAVDLQDDILDRLSCKDREKFLRLLEIIADGCREKFENS